MPRPPASVDDGDEASAGTSCSSLAAAKGRRESNLGLLPRSTKGATVRPEPPVPAGGLSCERTRDDKGQLLDNVPRNASVERTMVRPEQYVPTGPAMWASPTRQRPKPKDTKSEGLNSSPRDYVGIAHPHIDPISILISAEAQEHR